jgi:FkbM family methyltransferase
VFWVDSHKYQAWTNDTKLEIYEMVNKFFSYFKRRSYGLNELDLKLRPYLNFKEGFFVEAGANDGINQSNTLYFEKCKGWRGLLIEGIPTLAERCQSNRPKCIVENCALVAADYPEESIEMTYCNLMSIVKGTHNSVKSELNHIQSGRQHLASGEETYRVTVPARTFSNVLDKHNIKNVDFFCLDVEGYEAQVLKGIDFERHRIKFMLIEVRCREDVAAVISHIYKPVAILTANENYSDILYRRI